MSDSPEEQARSRTAEKSVVAGFMDRLMGFFGYSGLTPQMKTALDNAADAPAVSGGGLDALAKPLAACTDPVLPPALAPALKQIWSFRDLAGSLFGGKAGRTLSDRVRKLVRDRLRASGAPDLSAAIAERQLGLIRTWLSTGEPGDAAALAALLHAETRKLLDA